MIGFEGDTKNPFARKTRRTKNKSNSALDHTPFRGKFRWRRY